MKEYKTINKKPDINKFPLQKLNLHIQGKILYVTSTPYPNKKLFILTDKNVFYVIEKENTKLHDIFSKNHTRPNDNNHLEQLREELLSSKFEIKTELFDSINEEYNIKKNIEFFKEGNKISSAF